MSFLNPLFLIGALAVAVPIVVHLYRRQEARKIPFGSLLFVLHSPSRSWRRLRLRNLFLFVLRVLAILLVVLAFTRPYWASHNPASTSSARKSVVLLLDNSLSMRSGDRFERAKAQAVDLLESLRDTDSCLVVAFSDTATVLNGLHADRTTLVPIIEGLKPSFRRTDFGQALKLGSQLLDSAPNDLQEIHLISDFQQSGWRQEAGAVSIPDRVKIIPHQIAGSGQGNAWVEHIEVTETGERGRAEIKLAASVVSSDRRSVRVALDVNGKILGQKQVDLEPGRSTLVEFDSWPLSAGVKQGTVTIQTSDALAADNSAFVVINPLARQKLLLLTGQQAGRARYAEDLYVRKALAPESGAAFDIVSASMEAPLIDLAPFSAVLINAPVVVPAKLAETLAVFVNHGGGVVLIMGERCDVEDVNGKWGAFLPARLGRKRPESGSGFSLITSIQKQHEVFHIFQPVHLSYFLTTAFRAYLEAVPAQGSSVLMELGQGAPLLLERRVGRGRVLLYTSAFSTDWNDLPLKSVFLPFCQELVKYAMRFEENGGSLRVGESVTVNRLNPNFVKALDKVSGPGSAFRQGWKINAPDGRGIKLSEQELVSSPFLALEQPGFYETDVWNLHNVVAVNLDPAESDLTAINPQQMVHSILRKTARSGSVEAGGPIAPEQRTAWEQRRGLWWYLIAIALGLLVVEGRLANHYRATD